MFTCNNIGSLSTNVGGTSNATIAPVRIFPKDIDIFYIVMAVPVGGMDESCQEEGISHLLEHLMFASDAGDDILSDAKRKGIEINAYTSRTHTVYHVTTTTANWEAGMDIFAAIATNTLTGLSDERVKQEVSVVLHEASLRGGVDISGNPTYVCLATLDALMTSGTLSDTSLIGNEETLTAITAQRLRDFLSDLYNGSRKIVIACNETIENKVMRAAKSRLGDILNRTKRQPVSTMMDSEERRESAYRILWEKRYGLCDKVLEDCEPEKKVVMRANFPPKFDKSEDLFVIGRKAGGDTQSCFAIGMNFPDKLTFRETLMLSIFMEYVENVMFERIRMKRHSTYSPQASFVNVARGVEYHGHCTFLLTTLAQARPMFEAMTTSIADACRIITSNREEFEVVRDAVKESYNIMFASEVQASANYIAKAACDWDVWIMPDEVIKSISHIEHSEFSAFVKTVMTDFPVTAVAVVPERDAQSSTTGNKMLYSLTELLQQYKGEDGTATE